MNKPLLTLSIAIAAVLALVLASGRDAADGDTDGRDVSDQSETTGPASLAEPGAVDARSTAREPDRPRWVVEVRHAEGRAVDAARIVARWGDDRLEGEGERTEWSAPRPGAWMLTVTLDGEPAWTRRIVVPETGELRTIATLGGEATVVGTLRDEFGDPKAQHLIGFVPEGRPAPEDPREWLLLPHARSGGGGGFRATLPGAGSYRMFVGWGGDVVHEDAAPRELEPLTTAYVEVTLPVPTRVVLEAREADGGEPRPPYAVTIYRAEAILDREKPRPEMPPEGPLPDPDDPGLSEDERSELVAQLADLQRPYDRDAALRRISVRPEGFRRDRSAILGPDGTLELTGLPVGETLRFAAARVTEPFRVEGSATVDPLQTTRFVITFPAGDGSPTEVRSARLDVTLDAPRERRHAVGSVWR